MTIEFKDIKIPDLASIGMRAPHYMEIIEENPDLPWVEVHSENFFAQGGMALHVLERVRERYPLSLHGVGLSLGSYDGLDEAHLKKLKSLVDRFEPGLVSEHVSWSAVDGVFLNDLLPVPYTRETVKTLVSNIQHMQDYLGRQILIENPSTYLEFVSSEMPEYEFMNEVAKQSGCGLLLDINNIYVSARNHGFDAVNYINNIEKNSVQEMHLAGHSIKKIENGSILIDDHGSNVIDDVWSLYVKALERFGKVPTLIEWDNNIPELEILMKEAAKAQSIMDSKGMIMAGYNVA